MEARLALHRNQQAGHDYPTARALWSPFRASAQGTEVVRTLRRMAGGRERCMFCSDSLGGDIEHFVPVALHYELTFTWDNLLWICTNCNRYKNQRFPVDAF